MDNRKITVMNEKTARAKRVAVAMRTKGDVAAAMRTTASAAELTGGARSRAGKLSYAKAEMRRLHDFIRGSTGGDAAPPAVEGATGATAAEAPTQPANARPRGNNNKRRARKTGGR